MSLANLAAMIMVGLVSLVGNTASAEALSAGNEGDVVSTTLPLLSHRWASSLVNDGVHPVLAIAMDESEAVAKESSLYFDLLRLSDIERVSSCGPVDKPCPKPTCKTSQQCDTNCQTHRGVRICATACVSVTRCTPR